MRMLHLSCTRLRHLAAKLSNSIRRWASPSVLPPWQLRLSCRHFVTLLAPVSDPSKSAKQSSSNQSSSACNMPLCWHLCPSVQAWTAAKIKEENCLQVFRCWPIHGLRQCLAMPMELTFLLKVPIHNGLGWNLVYGGQFCKRSLDFSACIFLAC